MRFEVPENVRDAPVVTSLRDPSLLREREGVEPEPRGLRLEGPTGFSRNQPAFRPLTGPLSLVVGGRVKGHGRGAPQSLPSPAASPTLLFPNPMSLWPRPFPSAKCCFRLLPGAAGPGLPHTPAHPFSLPVTSFPRPSVGDAPHLTGVRDRKKESGRSRGASH